MPRNLSYCTLKASGNSILKSGVLTIRMRDTLFDALVWTALELLKIRGFPKNHKVKEHLDARIMSLNQSDKVCVWRWKIEQFHREAKQLTGLEKCQCRLPDWQSHRVCIRNMKPVKPFIKSNMECSLNISENNSNYPH